MALQFTWDEVKALANVRKHGVDFDEAKTVFSDPNSLTLLDERHSQDEARFVDLGLSERGRCLSSSIRNERLLFALSAVAKQHLESGGNMNSEPSDELDDEMLPEYDFSNAVRGKHAADYRQGYKVIIHRTDGTVEEHVHSLPDGTIMLDPDVRRYFPDTESVNEALRGLIRLIPHVKAAEKAR